MAKPSISIVLGSLNRLDHLKATIDSIRQNGISVPYEIIVIDGGSIDGSIQWLIKQKDIVTIVQYNRGNWKNSQLEKRSWGYYMNIAFRASHGKYVLLISDDNLILPGAVMNGFNEFERLSEEGQKVGALAFYWRNWPDMQHYWVGVSLGKIFVSFGMFLRSALDEVGWIDEDTYAFYCADIDLSLKLWQAGYTIMDCKTAFVEHHPLGNVFVPNTDDPKKFIDRWVDILDLPDKQKYREDLGLERSWITSDYTDPTNLALKFPKRTIVSRGKNYLLKFYKKILKA